jgi:hypothetical protein
MRHRIRALCLSLVAVAAAACVAQPGAPAPSSAASPDSPAPPVATTPSPAATTLPSNPPAVLATAPALRTTLPDPQETEAPQPKLEPHAFWARIGGDDYVPTFSSTNEIVAKADTVVVGTVLGLRQTREIPVEETGETMYMMGVEIRVDEVIAGSVVPGTDDGNLLVESLLAFEPAQARFDTLAASTPVGEQVMLFLWNKGEDAKRHGMKPDDPLAGEQYYLMLGGFEGYIRNVNGKADVSPDAPGQWIKRLAGRAFGDAVQEARAAAAAKR